MIAAAAVLALLAGPSSLQTDVTARMFGRASFFAGVCASLGWESSQERAVAAGDAWDRAHPDIPPAESVAQIELGVDDGLKEVTVLLQDLRNGHDLAAFGAALKTRCDAVARDFPAVVNRGAGTDADFEAALARIAQEQGAR